jgi:hypothetical protein
MPFHEALTAVYEHGIKPLVESMGMQCRRADEMYSAQGILGDIWESMQTAEIVIADLTGKNPNVMYELGLCHALWKRVILLSQNRDDVPFDLRAWRVIWYDFTFAGSRRLQDELQRAIKALRAEAAVESELVPITPGLQAKPPLGGSRPPRPPTDVWITGRITEWRPLEGRGYILADGERFYFNKSYLFSETMVPDVEKRAVFIPQSPLTDARNRRASRVFVCGSKLTGHITKIVESRGYGFADIVGSHGETHSLLILITDGLSLTVGSRIECTVSYNERGPIGQDVVIVED